jgi:hypothetical protein
MHEGTMATAAEQDHGIPTQVSGALCPVFSGGQETVAVAQKLTPSVCGDISWGTMVFQTRNALNPTGRDPGDRN